MTSVMLFTRLSPGGIVRFTCDGLIFRIATVVIRSFDPVFRVLNSVALITIPSIKGSLAPLWCSAFIHVGMLNAFVTQISQRQFSFVPTYSSDGKPNIMPVFTFLNGIVFQSNRSALRVESAAKNMIRDISEAEWMLPTYITLLRVLKT